MRGYIVIIAFSSSGDFKVSPVCKTKKEASKLLTQLFDEYSKRDDIIESFKDDTRFIIWTDKISIVSRIKPLIIVKKKKGGSHQ